MTGERDGCDGAELEVLDVYGFTLKADAVALFRSAETTGVLLLPPWWPDGDTNLGDAWRRHCEVRGIPCVVRRESDAKL